MIYIIKIINIQMEEIITEIRNIYDENKNLKQKVDIYESNLKELKNTTEELKNKNTSLEIKVKDLEEKNNSKSSKLIWENTQNIIKEKDNEIDKLKKDILYYERKNLIKSKQETNKQENNKQETNKQETNKQETNKQETNKQENITVEKKSKKSKKTKNIIITQNDIDDLEKDLLFIK